MTEVLQFIEVFRSTSNVQLFTQTACYWFAQILHQRFKNSSIVYNPDMVHFATKIDGVVYDITGVREDSQYYVDWESYTSYATDIDIISKYCINLERR